MFLVDSADQERLPESKSELDALLSDESLADIPFLILGNKIDIPNACSEDDIRHYLGLTNYTTGKGKVQLDKSIRPIEVFMCSVVSTVKINLSELKVLWNKGKKNGVCRRLPLGVAIHRLRDKTHSFKFDNYAISLQTSHHCSDEANVEVR